MHPRVGWKSTETGAFSSVKLFLLVPVHWILSVLMNPWSSPIKTFMSVRVVSLPKREDAYTFWVQEYTKDPEESDRYLVRV